MTVFKDRDEFLKLIEGRTYQEVADSKGVSYSTVINAAQRFGIKRRGVSSFPKLNDPVWLYDQFVVQRLDIKVIARKVGCSYYAAYLALTKYGLLGCNPKVPDGYREARA